MQNKKTIIFILVLVLTVPVLKSTAQRFPDSTPIPAWFSDTAVAELHTLGKKYNITDHGVRNDSTVVQTGHIQAVIDKAAGEGGGVIIIPKGVFLSGSLFFKPKTHLYLEEGATLKCSDRIADFKVVTTRIEGQSLKYFAALVNADGLDGFTISGKGTINGNGLNCWKAFWLRRQWNPECTNMDEQRPRLLFVSNSRNVQVSGVQLLNSPFWTSHYYKCENLKILGVRILAGTNNGFEVRAPSSDGIDLDVCRNVLIKNCYISVNDDGVCLKGGKGPKADKDASNGANQNIIVEDNIFDNCPSLTLGSESVFTHNVIMRRCTVKNTSHVLLLKMRPDTPQQHEYVLVEDITGTARNFLSISPWTQFFDLKGQPEPRSFARHITMRNCRVSCNTFLNIKSSRQYTLSDFILERLRMTAPEGTDTALDFIKNLQLKNITVNDKQWGR
ncbi:exopolygalacturonase [Niabella sp. CC-SYL272]|uniref:rhamnogalacturonidase n=1 Tax=Niabella agricola TaxID=2891571 RepID=UPI001F33AD11|nr:glycosyl hydrolase family 28 protein [Niabella agricola]MCF3108149.1 exopolygalacturonase [Niabella agricola]